MLKTYYREEFDGVAVGRVERDQDFTSKLGFYHNEYQIQYIFKGERFFFYEGECYRMGEGSIALIDKPQIAKTCIIGGKYHDRMLIEIREDILVSLGNFLGVDLTGLFAAHHGVYQVGELPEAVGILENVEKLIREDKSDTRTAKVKTEVLQILLQHEKWDHCKGGKFLEQGIKIHADKQRRVHQVADYIAEHFREIGSVEDLTTRFYMSSAYLCRIFKEVTNFTISEYINLYRMAAGRTLLADEKYSMTEIANMLGYDSLTYFERVFKKQIGMTPLQYRKQITRQR